MKLNFLFLTKFLVACFLAFCAFGFVACSDDDEKPVVDPALIGTWVDEWDEEITFKNDGTFVGTDAKGTYTANGNTITITMTHYYDDDGGWVKFPQSRSFTVNYSVDGSTFTMGDDTYTRQ